MSGSSDSSGNPLADLLARFYAGDVNAGEAIFLALEDRLVAIAHKARRGQPPSTSLQTLDILNLAVMKLMLYRPELNDGQHLVCYLARTMRSVLVEYHRQRGRRRAAESAAIGEYVRNLEASMRRPLDQGDDLLEKLREQNPLRAEILTLHLFGELPYDLIAQTLGIPKRTVEREARNARLWLRDRVED